MGTEDMKTAGAFGDRDLMRRLRHAAALADPAPPDADPVARRLLTWRTIDADLAALLGCDPGRRRTPGSASAGECRAPASAD